MTLPEAITRYIEACRNHDMPAAHDRWEELRQLRHAEVTAHEAAVAATPTVHAQGAIAA
jgi:hypothetical protein